LVLPVNVPGNSWDVFGPIVHRYRPTMAERAIDLVCGLYPVTPQDILSPRRDRETVRSRHMAIWLTKQLTRWTLTKIGKEFAGLDHSSVLYAVRTIDAERAGSTLLATILDGLISQLRASPQTEDATCSSPPTPAQ
jgi:chromosomal replication initiation ATPase DnaA